MDIQFLNCTVPDVLTPMEAAKILHIGRSTIYHLLAQGEIRSIRVKTKILIPKTFLQDFIAKYAEISYHGDIQMAENLSCCEKGEEV